jgi:hypothetical protein
MVDMPPAYAVVAPRHASPKLAFQMAAKFLKRTTQQSLAIRWFNGTSLEPFAEFSSQICGNSIRWTFAKPTGAKPHVFSQSFAILPPPASIGFPSNFNPRGTMRGKLVLVSQVVVAPLLA